MITKILIGAVILIGLAVAGWLAAPLFYDKQVNEELPAEFGFEEPISEKSTVIDNNQVVGTNSRPDIQMGDSEAKENIERRGEFKGADSFHKASGQVRILQSGGKRYARFESDFSVTNGPDLYVHLGRNGAYDADTNLGRLKGNKGSQNYEIPSHIDLDSYNEVWVWCRAFSVPFASADLG